MNTDDRKNAFIRLGNLISNYIAGGANNNNRILNTAIEQACADNAWFTPANIRQALAAIATDMLSEKALEQWICRYPQLWEQRTNKRVGIIMAGNIPLVGFHDLLCVLMCGYQAIIKPSSKDNALMDALIHMLCVTEPRFANEIIITGNRPVDVDALIATGSNNSARYFESWYAGVPSIIRRNRSSIAVLDGNESSAELAALGNDVFSYFGLGCRNVSTLLVPDGYDFAPLINTWAKYGSIIEHQSYRHCYHYQKAILEMEKTPYTDTGFFLIDNNFNFSSPIALLNYQNYANLGMVKDIINPHQNKTQCIVSKLNIIDNRVLFGQAQHPCLHDYADGIDTLNFLLNTLHMQ